MPTVLITGASSGIGLCVANLFHTRGWNVIATMRNPNASGLKTMSNKMVIVKLDVRSMDSITGAISQGIQLYRKIDVLINCVGEMQLGLFESISMLQVQEQFETNVFGAMNVIRCILPHFRTKKSGIIINLSGGPGIVGFPMGSVYSASKFALEGFTEALSYELHGVGIAVKTVIPHGTVSNTSFVAKAQRNMSTNEHVTPSYGPFVNKAFEVLSSTTRGFRASMSPEDVALTVWEAATDGKGHRLRYFVGKDKMIVALRYGCKSDEEYVTRVRKYYDLQAVSNSSPSP
ncbi:short-chain alcohol dehydrogenase [Flagelloscypha sp. PMI_526]|nr:short-chain alcohol dehydrogenase [Flagelloscypha sp. PMI_526]